MPSIKVGSEAINHLGAEEVERLQNLPADEKRAEHAELMVERDKLIRHENLTKTQETRYQEVTDGLLVLEAAIKRDALRAKVESGDYHVEGTDSSGRNYVGHVSGLSTGRSSSGDAARDNAMRLLDSQVRSKSLPEQAAAKVERLVSDGPDRERGIASRWAVAAGSPDYLTAFSKLVADPVRGHMLWTGAEQRAYQDVTEVRAAMSLTDANGGYMVPLTLDPAIMLTSDGSINPLRQISRVVQTVTDQWQGVTSAGATAEWKAEAAQAADGSPTIDDAPIPVHFGDVFCPFSYEVGMDARNFMSELSKVLVDAADQLMATAYTTGSGTGQPKGFVTALAGTASEINSTASEALSAADAYALQNALPARFQANAQWVANIATINQFAQYETANGALAFPEIREDRLLRKPLHELSNMDGGVNAAATANNYLMAYGDFKQFVIVDRIGTTLELIPQIFGTNGRPTGQRGAFLWFRTGSDVVVPQAFRLLDVPTTA